MSARTCNCGNARPGPWSRDQCVICWTQLYRSEWEAGRGPGLVRKAANYAKAVVQHLVGGLRNVDDQERARRLAICGTCPQFDAARIVCTHRACGCDLEAKARWQEQRCPLGKW